MAMASTEGSATASAAAGVASSAFLSKYEKVQIVAARVEQLLHGAAPLVPPDECGGDLEAVAELELERRLLPVRVARRLPNGKVSVHALDQLAAPASGADDAAARR